MQRARVMTAYDKWMTGRLYDACEQLTDGEIEDWPALLTQAMPVSDLEVTGIVGSGKRRSPSWVAVIRYFKHRIHHRGRLTALLSQCGGEYGVRVLIRLPGTAPG